MRIYAITLIGNTTKGGNMVKRLNAHIPDEMHRLLRIALAEDATDFSSWVRERINQYLVEKGKLPKPGKQRKRKEVG
jgi:hypothetical protein